MKRIALVLLTATTALAFSSCGDKDDKKGNSANLPLVTPPVRSAVPTSLQGTSSLKLEGAASSLSERFFNTAGGPSNVFRILAAIDDRISGINTLTGEKPKDCVSQVPVAYTLKPLGIETTFYAQCYQVIAAGGVAKTDGLVQYGIKDGVTYLYVYIGSMPLAVIATPIAGETGKYTIHAWTSVGTDLDNGSYGIMELKANSLTKEFEFTAAGTGLGYCGAQLKSDGTDIYALTSSDMGATCNAIETSCVLASDATTAGTCSDSLKTFELTPIGRKAATGSATTFGASLYPATPNVDLTGTAADTVHFGNGTYATGAGSL